MKDFPLAEAARDEIRAELIDHYEQQAYIKAKNHMLSLKCVRGSHNRCHNSGVTCLCRCHDRKGLFWKEPWKEPYGADG